MLLYQNNKKQLFINIIFLASEFVKTKTLLPTYLYQILNLYIDMGIDTCSELR